MTANITTFEIGLSHHSISRSRIVRYTGTLAGAKRKATEEFGDGYNDHMIIISVADEYGHTVAQRRCDEKRWTNI